jgi:G3E family GTPase
MQDSPVPVTIVGGFLGSGKTTLLNHIINQVPNKRIAFLVNDFGTINIDAKLIVSVEGETVSLANGCICCTIRDDLLVEVEKLLAREEVPEHIVIETSGVSKPVGVAETFFNPAVQGFAEVQSIIVVLDADLALDKNLGDEAAEYHDLAMDHIRIADLVVINKTDLVNPKRLATLKRKVEAIAARSRIWETSYGEVPLDLVFDDPVSSAFAELQNESVMQTHHSDQDHDSKFATWTYRSDAAWSFGALQRAVDKLPRNIYRAKGIVQLDLETNDYGIFNLTGKRSWLKLTEPELAEADPVATELVFIGKPDGITDDTIGALFEQALAEANAPDNEGYVVKDLRAFHVVFA